MPEEEDTIFDAGNLRRRMDQLEERLEQQDVEIEGVKVLGFQEQLNAFSDRIDDLEKENLILRRRMLWDRLTTFESQVEAHLHGFNHPPSFPSDMPNAKRLCISEVQIALAGVKGQLANSTTPETVLKDIEATINTTLQAHGYEPIRWTS